MCVIRPLFDKDIGRFWVMSNWRCHSLTEKYFQRQFCSTEVSVLFKLLSLYSMNYTCVVLDGLYSPFLFVVSVDGISAFVSRDMILRTPLTTANRGDALLNQGPSSSPRFSPSEPHRSSRPGSVSSSEGGRSSTSRCILFYRRSPLYVVIKLFPPL